MGEYDTMVSGKGMGVGRQLRLWAALLMLLTSVVSLGLPGAAAQDDEEESVGYASYLDETTGVEIPGDLGQAEEQLWVRKTAHTLRGYMLDYWRSQGAASVYGYPITEPFGAENGYYSQAFERGVFQFRPEYIWSDTPTMTLMPIAGEILDSRVGDVRRDGRRDVGGGDRRAAAWRSYGPESGVAKRAEREGGIYDAETGHSVTGDFLAWLNDHEGGWYLGSPLSQPVAERGMVVQYFEGALLMRSEGGRVWPAPLVREWADELKLDTAPVERNGLEEFRGERAMWTRDNPNPQGDPNAEGRKWIEVDLSSQELRAYQGSTLITSTLVSTGLEPNKTQTGIHHVRLKYPKQDMEGFTDGTGEVVATGEGDAPTGAASYSVEDVPNVMYINMEAEALHGAYWHNNFGTPMSHGCINLPLDFAEFLYGWAPLGTMVWVHN